MAPEEWSLIWAGVMVTLQLTAISAVFSLIIGIVIAVMRMAPITVFNSFAASYTEFFRNIPLLTVLFFIYYLPKEFALTPFTSAVAGFSLYTAAYVAEVIRAGLGVVSKGNVEAARSLGLTFFQSMRFVQLPQALRSAIPPLGTLLIALLKNTSLASTITIADLYYQANFVQSRSFDPNILLIAGAIYIALTLPTGALINVVERRWAIKR